MTRGLHDTTDMPSLYWIGISGLVNEGIHPNLSGTVTITGNCSGINGVLREDLTGVVSEELQGDITGIYGSVTDIHGNILTCDLTAEEREAGVDITDLIFEPTS